MNYYLWANIIVCAFALCGFIRGGVEFFRPRKAMYGKMITIAMLCIIIGRLFNIIRLLSGGNLNEHFQLGFLGIIGSIMFFFSANYGAIDSIVDDGTKTFFKYRMIGLVAPAVVVLLYFPLFLTGDISLRWRIQAAVLVLFEALSSYFHLKHLVMPDVEFGVVKGLKPYNLFALLYMVSSVIECFALSRGNAKLTFASCLLSAIFILSMMFMTIRGLNRWKKERGWNI